VSDEPIDLDIEMPKESRTLYIELAKELIKSSISRIEENASRTLSLVTLIATLYAAIVGFWVTTQNALTPVGSVLMAIPEMLLILSVVFLARVLIPTSLKPISPLSPELTYETHSDLVESKTVNMKRSFALLILALVFILVVMLSLSMFRDVFLQKVSSG
jgi:hypothetical protein